MIINPRNETILKSRNTHLTIYQHILLPGHGLPHHANAPGFAISNGGKLGLGDRDLTPFIPQFLPPGAVEFRNQGPVAQSVLSFELSQCHAAIFFGSRARDTAQKHSDTDILLITEDETSARISFGVAQFTLRSAKMLDDAAAEGDLFIASMLDAARPIWDPDGALETLTRAFRPAKDLTGWAQHAIDLLDYLVHPGNRPPDHALQIRWAVRVFLYAQGLPVFNTPAALPKADRAFLGLCDGYIAQKHWDGPAFSDAFAQLCQRYGAQSLIPSGLSTKDAEQFFKQTNNQTALAFISAQPNREN